MQNADGQTVALIQLAVVRHIGSARRVLRQRVLDDEAVHDARKDLKRARSGLRLLRPLDEHAYVRENVRLRDLARQLSGLRDNKVLLGRTADLLGKVKQPESRRLILALRKELHSDRRRDWRALRSADGMHRMQESLATAARHVRDWAAPAEANAAPALALRRLYRKGRKALARSQKDPNDERLHEARKHVKHLAQALEILTGKEPPKKARKVLARAEDVGDRLGDDHDLAVVEARLDARPNSGAGGKKKLRKLLEQRRAGLQKKALKAADKLFRKKTKRVLVRAAVNARAPRSA